jgi:hypothetical protein
MQLYPFIAAGRVRQLSQTIRDTVATSNAEAVQRGAVHTADRLQRQAHADKSAALNELATFRKKKAELAGPRVALSKQAAATYGRLQGLLNQRAAYNQWVADEQRRRAAAERARQERLRQEERARQAGPATAGKA